ncbi:MAG TPA: hypothetical protein VK601_01840 [Kofleriaceae bacterium]|nr:hypothetical protein [Kofleriaceae bacterium]
MTRPRRPTRGGTGVNERGTPTRVDGSTRPVEQGTPTELVARPERSEPIRVFSMKDRTEAARPHSDEPRAPLHVQLRAMADVAGLRDTPAFGHLAPPRDPRQARNRRRRANVAWAGVAVVLACGISLVIWLIAGR